MVDLLFVFLFQVAADAPAPAPEQQATEQTPPDTTATTEEENVTVEAPDQDRVRCRRAEPGVGSIIGRRICSTPRQDRERQEHDAQQLDTYQRRQTGVCIPNARTGGDSC